MSTQFIPWRDHVATHTVIRPEFGPEIEIIRWMKPGTSIDSIWFIRHGNVLIVRGDWGEAVYQWHETNTLKWISECDVSYFASKCRASETGIGYREWEPLAAKAWLDDFCDESQELKQKLVDASAWEAADSHVSWVMFLHEYCDIFGGDGYEFSNVGFVVHMRCRGHLEALKHAVNQLIDRGILGISAPVPQQPGTARPYGGYAQPV